MKEEIKIAKSYINEAEALLIVAGAGIINYNILL